MSYDSLPNFQNLKLFLQYFLLSELIGQGYDRDTSAIHFQNTGVSNHFRISHRKAQRLQPEC